MYATNIFGKENAMFVWAVADRFLDIVGLLTLLYWTVKITLGLSRKLSGKPAAPRSPKAFRLD